MTTTIALDELRELVAATGATLVDLRNARIFDHAHIPGAINVAPDGLGQAVADGTIPTERPVVVYNRKADGAETAAATLREAGVPDVRAYTGGIVEWIACGQECQPPLKGWACGVCSYGYHPQRGDQSQGAEPGTLFEELPATWRCPWCGAPKDRFIKETWT